MVRKNYKKFVATAATATLVASAIAPVASADVNTAAFTDVPDSYKDAIDFLVSNNIASGKTETQFDIHGNITRGDFAAILARAAGLIDADAPSTGFTDVPDSRALIVNSLKDAGVINGVSATQFGYAQNIKRGDAAKMITKAFDLDSSDEASKFTDVSASYQEAVNALVQAGVTNGKTETQFGVHDNIKRGDFAKWIHALEDYVNIGDGETPSSGITSVKSINDTTVEVKFAQAVDKDFVREAERNGEYFRLYLEGDSVSSDNAVKSDSINFSSDRKTATFTLGETIDGEDADHIESGKRYYVALTDSSSAAASVEYSYGPTELKASATKPNFEVSATSDKIIVNFGEEMKSSALKAENYDVYDNGGRNIGNLDSSDFVKELDNGNGEWVNASTKTAVEFKLSDNNKLKAGETYKLRVNKDVQTDSNKNLSDNDRTITVKTPSISEAKPKATTARAASERTIVVSFDQNIGDVQELVSQVEVKTATNKTIDVTGVEKNSSLANNELEITVDSGKDNELKVDETYKVSLPANITTNAVFTNAANDAVSNITAKAQENVEIKSVKAELKADPKDRTQANLHLEFDQRPDIEVFESSNSGIKIVDGSTVHELRSVENVKYTGDKSIVLEGVNAEGAFEKQFKPETGTSYTLEIDANTIKTDAFGTTNRVQNQSKLKTTFGGVSVAAPVVDKVTLVSATEIKVEFKNDITSVNKDDIQVQGFERLSNGKFEGLTLTGDDIKTSTSGKTLTLKTNGDRLFHTGIADTDIKITANSFSSKGSEVANDEIKINETDIDEKDFVDNAGPVLVGAYTENTSNAKQINFTFTEDIKTKGDGKDIAKLFSVSNAANNSVGESTNLDNGNSGYVEFNKVVFEEDTIMSRIEVKYAGSNTFYIQDEKGNKAENVTIKGVSGEKPEVSKPGTGPENPAPGDDIVTELTNTNVVFDFTTIKGKYDVNEVDTIDFFIEDSETGHAATLNTDGTFERSISAKVGTTVTYKAYKDNKVVSEETYTIK